MADPRFYDNRGPVTLAQLCAASGAALPKDADGQALIHDVAGLAQAGPRHVSFFEGARAKKDFELTKAGWCFVKDAPPSGEATPANAVLIPVSSVAHAFAAAAKLFYPDHSLLIAAQDRPVHATAKLGEGVVLAPGVVIGPGAEIGDGVRIGAHAVIGRGVTIGRQCEIGAHAVLSCAHFGDEGLVFPGACIGTPGFRFASSAKGHEKVPQLGRVIVQDRVEFGANSTIDRGGLGDTVIGEGTKIDNLVHIGHNTVIGRHCVITGHVGISGSVSVGDFVVFGGMSGAADHVAIGDHVRIAGLSGVTRDLPGGQDYGGMPARPIMQWRREAAALARLSKGRGKDSKRTKDD